MKWMEKHTGDIFEGTPEEVNVWSDTLRRLFPEQLKNGLIIFIKIPDMSDIISSLEEHIQDTEYMRLCDDYVSGDVGKIRMMYKGLGYQIAITRDQNYDDYETFTDGTSNADDMLSEEDKLLR